MPEQAKKVRIRVAEALESGVEGILLFVVRYFRTSAFLIFSPRRMARRLLADRHASKPSYVLPLTYLSIGLFLLSLLSQVAGISIFDWMWYMDELAARVTDALSKEISLVKVAVQALPGVVVVGLLGWLLRLGLRGTPISSRLVPFVLSYAFGVQTWALFMTTFGFVALGTLVGKWEPPGGKVGSSAFAGLIYLSLIGGLLLAFIAPVVFATSALRLRRVIHRGRWLGWGVTVSLAGSLLLGHVALLYAMGLPSKIMALATEPTSPDLTIRHQAYSVADGRLRGKVTFLLTNPGKKSLGWEVDQMELMLFERADGLQQASCSTNGVLETLAIEALTDDGGKAIRFVSVAPGQTQWFELTATKAMSGWLNAVAKQKSTMDLRLSMRSLEGESVAHCIAGKQPTETSPRPAR